MNQTTTNNPHQTAAGQAYPVPPHQAVPDPAGQPGQRAQHQTQSAGPQAPQNPGSNPFLDKVNNMVASYWNKKGGMELLTGLAGLDYMERANENHFKNREAEEAFVRKNVWGAGDSGSAGSGQSAGDPSGSNQSGSDTMRQTILGDYNPPAVVYPPMVQQQPPSSGAGKAMAAAALTAASLLGGGAAGYFLGGAGKPNTERVIETGSGNEYGMGLGRFEEYFPPQSGPAQPGQAQPGQAQPGQQ